MTEDSNDFKPLELDKNLSVAGIKDLVVGRHNLLKNKRYRWILGVELTEDHKTLDQYPFINYDNETFLYLIAPVDNEIIEVPLHLKPDTMASNLDGEVINLQQVLNAIDEIDKGPPQQSNWECSRCTLLNPASTENCEACTTSRKQDNDVEQITDEEEEKEEEDATTWKCSTCTFLNVLNKDDVVCELCGTSRQDQRVLDETKWKCSRCTFLNSSTTGICEVCGSPQQEPGEIESPSQRFPCSDCGIECLPGQGIKLRECHHQFCRNCLALMIEFSSEPEINCPQKSGDYLCAKPLHEDEIKSLVCPAVYKDYQDKCHRRKLENYYEIVNLEHEGLVKNSEQFECVVCLTDCAAGDGVILRECLHQFCRECLANTIENSEDAVVKCPYIDERYTCDSVLQDREIKALVTAEVYENHLARSITQAENAIDNSFHCKTPDCKGWCIYEDDVNNFFCLNCQHTNCLTCQVIHEEKNCKEYQEDMRRMAETDEEARKTRDYLEEMIRTGEALHCPTCQVIILKKIGCDWILCSMCKTELCWATKGPRWGPKGHGDTNGGCRCGVNGRRCHPQCNYCH